MGHSIADSTKKLYDGGVQQMENSPPHTGKIPFLADNEVESRSGEDSLLEFAALHMGPFGKDHATVATYMSAITHFRRMRDVSTTSGKNEEAPSPHDMGAERNKCPTKRKLPATAEDMKVIYHLLDVRKKVDNCIALCAILTGWYFAMRMSEYLATGKEGGNRHPCTWETSNRWSAV